MIIKPSKLTLEGRQQEGGMTIVELMISMVVLAVGLGGLAIMFVLGMTTNNRNAKDTTATMLAQSVLEKISAQPANAPANITITDCAGNNLTVATTGAAGPAGQGARLVAATGQIDQTQALNAVPANYAMQYVSCGTASRQVTYEVRWNVITVTAFSRLITVSARQSQGTGVGSGLGGATFAMPVTLRTIGGMAP